MTVDTKKLREIAEAATPGEWRQGSVETHNVFVPCADGLGPERVLLRMNNHEPFREQFPRDAAFIAAANPAVVLELLNDLGDAAIANQKWQDHFTTTPGLAAANAEIVALKHQLAAKDAEIERLKNERLADAVVEAFPRVANLKHQLANMTRARDSLAEIAEAATFVIDNVACIKCRNMIDNIDVEQIDALRKVGAK